MSVYLESFESDSVIPNSEFSEKSKQTLRDWAEEDQPRERLMTHGRRFLSDTELIAILLGSGTKEHTAVEVARQLLDRYQKNLRELSKVDYKELCQIKGIGPVKAVKIIAALELARRMEAAPLLKEEHITCSKDAYLIFRQKLIDLDHEEFHVCFLNQKNKVIATERISEGGLTATIADGRKIFRSALLHQATSIILCHNHPSGNLKASDEDIRLTKKLKQAGEQLDIRVFDHIIIASKGYVSFMDEGLL